MSVTISLNQRKAWLHETCPLCVLKVVGTESEEGVITLTPNRARMLIDRSAFILTPAR